VPISLWILRCGDGGDVIVGQLCQLLLGFEHALVMGRAEGQRELAVALVIAVNAIVMHQLFDGVNGIVVLAEHLHGPGPP
jgi:hypothetical protein